MSCPSVCFISMRGWTSIRSLHEGDICSFVFVSELSKIKFDFLVISNYQSFMFSCKISVFTMARCLFLLNTKLTFFSFFNSMTKRFIYILNEWSWLLIILFFFSQALVQNSVSLLSNTNAALLQFLQLLSYPPSELAAVSPDLGFFLLFYQLLKTAAMIRSIGSRTADRPA